MLFLPFWFLHVRLYHMTGGQNQLHCLLKGHEMEKQNVLDIYMRHYSTKTHSASVGTKNKLLSLKYELFLSTLLKWPDLKLGLFMTLLNMLHFCI